jgi:hypothetical protein
MAAIIQPIMPGTLHIFRLQNDPLQYQVNYNIGANSWVQVFTPAGLEEFLRTASALPSSEVDAMLEELHSKHHTTEGNVYLGESHLGEMGFAESPSDE